MLLGGPEVFHLLARILAVGVLFSPSYVAGKLTIAGEMLGMSSTARRSHTTRARGAKRPRHALLPFSAKEMAGLSASTA